MATNKTNINTDEQRLAKLQSKGLGTSSAAKNLESKISGGTTTGNVPGTTTPTTRVSPTAEKNRSQLEANKIARAAGNSLLGLGDDLLTDVKTVESGDANATIKATGTTLGETEELVRRMSVASNKSATTTPTQTTGVGVDTISSQGNKSKVNSNLSVDTNLGRLDKDSTNTYTSRLGEEEKQAKSAITATEKAYDEQAKLDAERVRQLEIDAAEEQKRERERAMADAEALRAKQVAKEASDEASLASLKATQDAAERELTIANDVELQKANVNFARLGLTLSTAGITSAQQIYTTGAYNLAKLKTENAYKYASLQEQIAATEFEHTRDVNKIIRDSENKNYTIRQKLNEDVYKIQSSIIMSKKEKVDAVNKLIDGYQNARDENENMFLEKLGKSSTVLNNRIKGYYDSLKTKESYSQEKISTYIENGKWNTLSPTMQAELEKAAGYEPGTMVAQVKTFVGNGLYKAFEGYSLPSGIYDRAFTEALDLYQNKGIPLSVAVKNVADKYIRQSPEWIKKNTKSSSGGGGSSSNYKETVNYINPKTNDVVAVDVSKSGVKTVNGAPFKLEGYVEATASKPDIDDEWSGL